MSKWVKFELVAEKPKTQVYHIKAKDGNILLGTIAWYGAWRKYSFFPEPNTIYEDTCLRDIANFIDTLNKKRIRDKLKKLG